MMALELVAASANVSKLREIKAIFGNEVLLIPRPVEVPAVVESATTLEGNARLKAAAISAFVGLPAVADDTGLEVDVLEGEPGVRSARYAGEKATDKENVSKLLAKLDGVSTEKRTARFRTVAIVVWPDNRELVAAGLIEGEIVTSPRGYGGFGYDSVFAPKQGGGRTFAEMNDEEKNRISHRGRAFRLLVNQLKG